MIILANILVILIVCCLTSCAPTSTSKIVTKTYTEQVPYYEEEIEYRDVTKPKLVVSDKYLITPPLFPLKDYVLKIAVLPFTHSNVQNNKGIEVSEEIEFELIKRAGKFQDGDSNEVFTKVKAYLDGRYCGIDDDDIEGWVNNNKQKKYEFINRTLINEVLKEPELQNLTSNSIRKAKKMLGVDALLTGHVKSSNELSFIVKAIDTKTSKVVFAERYEGGYSDAIQSAVDAFYFNIVKTGEKCIDKVTTTEKLPVKKQVKKYKNVTKTREIKMCLRCVEFEDVPGGGGTERCVRRDWFPCGKR